MTKKTKHLGYDSGNRSSDRWMAPQKPYTGDGNTTRQPHDPVRLDNPPKDPNG